MRQLNFVSSLVLLGILLSALGPFAAAAHRGLPMATHGEKGADQTMAAQAAGAGGSRTEPAMAVKEAEMEGVRRSSHFRTRKLPCDVKTRFDGHVLLTADYHPVQKHPPTHN